MIKTNKKINVAYLMGSLNRGGAETLLLDCFNYHSEAGFNMMAVHRNKGVLINDFYRSGVRMFELRPLYYFDIFYFFKLRRILKQNNISILHAQQSLDTLYGYIASIGLEIQLVTTFHGHGIGDSRMSRIIRKASFYMSNMTLFVSEFQRNYYQQNYFFNKKSKVVYNGIDFNKLKQYPGGESFRKGKELLLGSVGNFTSGRDQLTLCKFLLLLKQNNILFSFIFVGKKSESEPEIHNKCISFCKENGLEKDVYFLGSREDVPNLLKQMDVFLYSTVHDTFGIAIVEAMASGIPVFVNDWEVMKEITNNGKWAVLYESKNANDLYNKFILFYENQDVYKKRAVAYAEDVKGNYNIKSHIDNLESIYQSILEK